MKLKPIQMYAAKLTDELRDHSASLSAGTQAAILAEGNGWGKVYLVCLNGGPLTLPRMLLRQWIIGTEPGDDAIKAFRDTLRMLVDQWIDSGKSGGTERPWGRSAPVEPLNALVTRHPMFLEYRHPIAKPNDLRFSMFPLILQLGEDLIMAAQDVAGYLFIELLRSPESSRLSRCDSCGKYFVRARKPKLYTVINRGSFCQKHLGQGGYARVKASRDNRKNLLIELAVEYWPQWKPTHRHGNRSLWIANRVNQRLPRGVDAISGKWITQNQSAIETHVAEEGINA